MCTIVIIFCLQVWKGVADSKKTKRLSKHEIKKQLSESIIINYVVESEELNKQTEEIQQPEEAAKVIKQYEDIIKTKKKGIISIAYYQGKIFKIFKEKEKFIKLASQPKLLRSSIGIGFFKNYYKDIKTVCKEYEEDFR